MRFSPESRQKREPQLLQPSLLGRLRPQLACSQRPSAKENVPFVKCAQEPRAQARLGWCVAVRSHSIVQQARDVVTAPIEHYSAEPISL